MLKPALLYKDELNKKFAEQLYSQDYFLYTGCDGVDLHRCVYRPYGGSGKFRHCRERFRDV